MTSIPTDLTQFRVETRANGLVHLIFDCPDRTMNVFSNKAIHELGRFAEWLHTAEVGGALLRSGKDNGFCAGADLTELGVAYDMVVNAPAADRFDLAYNHFFPLSHAIRRLETAGKPVAAAIAGVAFGGGCELALGAHYRVITDSPRATMGLPECQVGLLPGAGGTQRMPRLVGVDTGLKVLLEGLALGGQQALDAGLVHAVVAPGGEIAAAEAWLLSDAAHAVQPWDLEDATPLDHHSIAQSIATARKQELARMLGHEPAPIAILDCVELGLMQPIDGAIRSEMSVFAHLIQRPEPRNMIRTNFLGKQGYDKAKRQGRVPPAASAAAVRLAEAVEVAVGVEPALSRAGFGHSAQTPVQQRVGKSAWICGQPALVDALAEPIKLAAHLCENLDPEALLVADHMVTMARTIPAYLGGVQGLAALASHLDSGTIAPRS